MKLLKKCVLTLKQTNKHHPPFFKGSGGRGVDFAQSWQRGEDRNLSAKIGYPIGQNLVGQNDFSRTQNVSHFAKI